MKTKHLLIAAFTAMLALAGCGGGGGGSSGSTAAATVYDAPALVKTDTVVGTGTEAAAGSVVTVGYTAWLYDSTKADFKGAQIDTGSAYTVQLITSATVAGWVQGVPGMKVGGKRTLILPSSLGYGASGYGSVPANSGLVFDITLTAVTPVYEAPALLKVDTVVGTGAEAAVGKSITVNYTLWLYDATKIDYKGTQVGSGTAFTATLASTSLIEGWVQGLPGTKVGGKRTLVVPSSLGYGSAGSGAIPGSSGLVFDIELTAVN